eukprot:6490466-Amphidinium_carterae.3
MVAYRDWHVPAKVKSVTEHIEVALHARVREFEFVLSAPVKASRDFVWDLKRSKARSGGMTGEQLEAIVSSSMLASRAGWGLTLSLTLNCRDDGYLRADLVTRL